MSGHYEVYVFAARGAGRGLKVEGEPPAGVAVACAEVRNARGPEFECGICRTRIYMAFGWNLTRYPQRMDAGRCRGCRARIEAVWYPKAYAHWDRGHLFYRINWPITRLSPRQHQDTRPPGRWE